MLMLMLLLMLLPGWARERPILRLPRLAGLSNAN